MLEVLELLLLLLLEVLLLLVVLVLLQWELRELVVGHFFKILLHREGIKRQALVTGGTVRYLCHNPRPREVM